MKRKPKSDLRFEDQPLSPAMLKAFGIWKSADYGEPERWILPYRDSCFEDPSMVWYEHPTAKQVREAFIEHGRVLQRLHTKATLEALTSKEKFVIPGY